MSDPSAIQTPVLVLGATSLVGRFALPRLQAAGVEHVALSRTAPDEPGWVRADLWGPELEGRLPVCPTVLSLSPVWHLPPALGALKSRGMQRLVAFSSTSVITKAASPGAYEQGVGGRLGGGEEAVRSFCAANGVAWTLLRPTLIYAEGHDQNVSRLAGMIGKLGFLPLAGRGEGLRQPVHADDLAGAAIAAAAGGGGQGQAYEQRGGEPLTYRARAERVFEGMGRKPAILAVPQG